MFVVHILKLHNLSYQHSPHFSCSSYIICGPQKLKYGINTEKRILVAIHTIIFSRKILPNLSLPIFVSHIPTWGDISSVCWASTMNTRATSSWGPSMTRDIRGYSSSRILRLSVPEVEQKKLQSLERQHHPTSKSIWMRFLRTFTNTEFQLDL